MDAMTIFGLTMALIFVLFFMGDDSFRNIHDQSHNSPRSHRFSDHHSRSRSHTPGVNSGVRSTRIEGEICWLTGMRRSDCPCGSCKS
jgi:hypothetical protein